MQTRLPRRAQLAGFIIRLFALLCSGAALGQTGPVLPSPPTLIFTALTKVVITNTASETNVQAGRTFNQALTTNLLNFNYADRNALLADGWSFMAVHSGTNRDTEITNSANGLVVDYDQNAHPGSIVVPCDRGDLWNINNARTNLTRNFLSCPLVSNWIQIELTASFNPTAVRQEAGLALYQDDDNFVLLDIGYSTLLDSITYNTNPGDREACVWEYGGVLAPSYAGTGGNPHSHSYDLGSPNHIFRWDRYTQGASNNCVQSYWSYNNAFNEVGVPWGLTGSYQPPQVVNPRIGIWTGCDAPATPGSAAFTLTSLQVIAYNTVVGFSYSLLSAPAGASIDSHGIITWNPTLAQMPSTNVFVTQVTDDGVPAASATNSFTVILMQSLINTPPVFPPRPDVLVGVDNVNNTLTVTNAATDADNPPNPLTYQLIVAPAGATINTNGVITWTPNSSQVNTTNRFVTVVTDFNAQATNSQSLSATNSFNVIILPPPWPAFISQPPIVTIDEQTMLIVTNAATDGNLNVPVITTNALLFDYSSRADLLAAGWSFIGTDNANNPRSTENNSPAGTVDYSHPGVVRIPCDVGDLWGLGGNTRNSLFRTLPTNWLSARLAVNFAPVNSEVQQAHLCLYQNDDNYVQVGVAYHISGGEFFSMDREVAGSATTPAKASAGAANLYFRLDRNPTDSTITGFYSLDGLVWTTLATTTAPFSNPRLAIWTGGASMANADQAVLELRRMDLVYVTNTPAVLSYSLINLPSNASSATIDTNGVIRWQTTEADGPGWYTFTTVASENGLAPLRATNVFTVNVQEINTAPVLPVQPDLVITSVVPLLPIIVTNTATDSNIPPAPLTYTLTSGPTNAVINPNGIIYWIPTVQDLPSTNRFTTVVTAYDQPAVNAQYLSATNSFSVILPPGPLPPNIQPPALASGQAVITWNANVGALYRVQYKTSLDQTNWTDLPPDIRATTSTLSVTNAIDQAASRFYRVILLPP